MTENGAAAGIFASVCRWLKTFTHRLRVLWKGKWYFCRSATCRLKTDYDTSRKTIRCVFDN